MFLNRLFSPTSKKFKDLPRWQRAVWMFNILLVLYSIIAFLAIHIPPARFWVAGFLTLSTPVVLAVHSSLIIYWLIHFSRRALLSLLILLIAFPLLKRTFALHWDKATDTERSFTVLSYNTQLFSAHDYFNNGDKLKPKQAIEWLTQNEADIKCLQEFYDQDGSRVFNSIHRIAMAGNYHYYITPLFYENHNWKGFYGVAIFSKFPIVKTGDIIFDRQTLNKGIFADVKIGQDTVRVFSVHLYSMNIQTDKLDFSKDYSAVKSDYRDVLKRLKNGFLAHSRQITTLDRYIRNSPHPVIVCGDFNALPYSFTYQKVRRRLNNAFEDAGNGFGFTYNNDKLFFLRIDNQFYSGGLLNVRDFRTHHDVTFSDHFPISATYTIGQDSANADQVAQE